jgi:hypothetical protein
MKATVTARKTGLLSTISCDASKSLHDHAMFRHRASTPDTIRQRCSETRATTECKTPKERLLAPDKMIVTPCLSLPLQLPAV